MVAFAPYIVSFLAAQRYFDADVPHLPDQGFGLGEVATDIDFFTLEHDQQTSDEIALGNTPGTGAGGFAVARGDGYGHETARQASAPQEIHYGPAHAGCVHDQGCPPAQFRARDEA